MEKQLYAWTLMNSLSSTHIRKADARALEIWLPFQAHSQKYVWASSDEEARELAIDWCNKELKAAEKLMQLKRPYDDKLFVHLVGVARDIQGFGEVDEIHGIELDGRKLMFLFAGRYRSLQRAYGDIINPSNEGSVREITQEEQAEMRRAYIKLVN